MTTIFNPLTNRNVKESGVMGSILVTIRNWENAEKIKKTAKRMYEQYFLKPNRDWETDFLKIVEYYSVSHLNDAKKILKKIQREQRQRQRNGLPTMAFLQFLMSGISNEATNNKNIKPNSTRLNKFLTEARIEEKKCECAICLNFEESNDQVVQLKCKHQFHSCCIKKWISNVQSCPMCKAQVDIYN
jgi:hypothetical protein